LPKVLSFDFPLPLWERVRVRGKEEKTFGKKYKDGNSVAWHRVLCNLEEKGFLADKPNIGGDEARLRVALPDESPKKLIWGEQRTKRQRGPREEPLPHWGENVGFYHQ
jgi:hypothetical protein